MRNIAADNIADLESIETSEWLDSLDYVLQSNGPARAGQLLLQLSDHARRRGIRLPFTANTPYVNTLTHRPGSAVSRQPGDRAPHQEPRALERDRDGAAREQERARHRRPYLDVRVGGDAVRSRLQSFLQGGQRRRSRRRVLPGARGARHLLARVSRRAPHRKAARQFPPRARAGRRPVVVSASVADARLLGISHRVDGARPDHGDLSGAVHPLPGRSRAEEAVELESVGVSRRRRDRRARIARRHHAARAREDRQPDFRRQLQPAAARRPGARQRPDHSGARSGVPRRGLERHQGDLGQGLGSAARERQRRPARQADGRDRRRRVSEVHRRVRRVPAEALLGQVPAAARDGQAPLRRRSEEADARRPRSGEGLQRLQSGGRAQGTADGSADSHDQRLRARRRGRREEHHPSAEEAHRRRAARRSRALQHSRSRRKTQRGAVLPARRQEP